MGFLSYFTKEELLVLTLRCLEQKNKMCADADREVEGMHVRFTSIQDNQVNVGSRWFSSHERPCSNCSLQTQSYVALQFVGRAQIQFLSGRGIQSAKSLAALS